MGIALLPPDINRSYARFRPETYESSRDGLAIRFGLSGIKQISGTLETLIATRNTGGDFKSLLVFHKRAGGHFNRAQTEKLAEAGAFDQIADCRYQASSVLSWLRANMRDPGKQTDLFGGSSEITIPVKVGDVQEWGDKMDREFRSVGFWFNTHPLDAYRSRLERAGIRRKFRFLAYMQEKGMDTLSGRKLSGLVTDVMRFTSRRGLPYIKAVLAEKRDHIDVMFFGNNDFPIDRVRETLEDAKASRDRKST